MGDVIRGKCVRVNIWPPRVGVLLAPPAALHNGITRPLPVLPVVGRTNICMCSQSISLSGLMLLTSVGLLPRGFLQTLHLVQFQRRDGFLHHIRLFYLPHRVGIATCRIAVENTPHSIVRAFLYCAALSPYAACR